MKRWRVAGQRRGGALAKRRSVSQSAKLRIVTYSNAAR